MKIFRIVNLLHLSCPVPNSHRVRLEFKSKVFVLRCVRANLVSEIAISKFRSLLWDHRVTSQLRILNINMGIEI